MFLSDRVSAAAHLSSILRMPPFSENQFLPLSSALFLQLCEQDQGEGINLPPRRSERDNKWFSSTDTPSAVREEKARKTGPGFWGPSANRRNYFRT